jgi:hypothetical protein
MSMRKDKWGYNVEQDYEVTSASRTASFGRLFAFDEC